MDKNILNNLKDRLSGFTARNEKFLFTTLSRILAIGCLIVAAYYVWKLSGQLNI